VTINVGVISGGTSKNTVPDHAQAQLDLRFESIADGEKLIADLRAAAESHGVEGVTIALTGGVARQPLERTEASVALMNAYGECAKESGLGMSEASLIGGGSDASTSFAMGIASIDGLGPRGIGFHTKDEQIEIATLVLKAQALARFLMQWK
jgi:glutamate carboxypeptidase